MSYFNSNSKVAESVMFVLNFDSLLRHHSDFIDIQLTM